MSVWPRLALREVLTPAVNTITLHADQMYAQVTARLWGKGLILRGRVSGAEIAAARQNRVHPGQFVISKIDARHGAFGLVPAELDGAVVSNDFPVFNVESQRVLPEFIAWVAKTDWFVALCKNASEGSTNRVRLKEERFLAQEIPLPPMPEQQRIVERLNSATAAAAACSRRAKAVEGEIATTLRAAYAGLAGNAPRIAMGDIAPLVRRPVLVDPDAIYLELGVRSFGRGTFHKPALPGIEVGSKKLFRVEADDLVFNIVFAWEGALAVARDEDAGRVGSHRFLTCVPDPRRATVDFLRYWFLTEEGLLELSRASPGGAGRNRTLGIKALEAIRVPVPPLNAQHWFNRLQAKAGAARAAQAAAAEELDALLPAMLHEIFAKHCVTAPPSATKTDTVVSLPMKSVSAAVSAPFKEAVLVCAIVKVFNDNSGQPLGNFRLQKGVYFARRFMGERNLSGEYLRKAAGPYNPTMRYSGGIKLAVAKSWIVPTSGKYGAGHSPGPAIRNAENWIEEYQFARAAAWVRDKFKFRPNHIWEILATVDYAILAIERKGLTPDAHAILSYIDGDAEWHPKIARLGLTLPVIDNAMAELECLLVGV